MSKVQSSVFLHFPHIRVLEIYEKWMLPSHTLILTYFNIKMDDAVFMHVFKTITNLSHVVDNLTLSHFIVLCSYSVK